MKWEDMVSGIGPWMGYYNAALAERIKEHGVDWESFLRQNNNPAWGQTFENALASLAHHYGTELAEKGINAPSSEIHRVVDRITPNNIVFFNNLEPNQFAFSNWQHFYDQPTDVAKAKMKELLSRPEFYKEAIRAIPMHGNAGAMFFPYMPTISQDDVKYILSKVANDWTGITHVDAPETLIREALKDEKVHGSHTLSNFDNIAKVASKMLKEGELSDDEKVRLHDLVIDNYQKASRGIGYSQPEHIKHMKDAVDSISDEDFKKYAEDNSLRRTFFEVTGRVPFKDSHELILDEVARDTGAYNIAERFSRAKNIDRMTPADVEKVYSQFGKIPRMDGDWQAVFLSKLPREKAEPIIKWLLADGKMSPETAALWPEMNQYGHTFEDPNLTNDLHPSGLSKYGRNKLEMDGFLKQQGQRRLNLTKKDLVNAVYSNNRSTRLVMRALTHANADKDVLSAVVKQIQRGNLDPDELARVPSGMGKWTGNGVLEGTIWDDHMGHSSAVRVGSTALRHLRDHLQEAEAAGTASIRPEELPKGKTWNTITRPVTDKKGNVQHVLDWNPLRDAKKGGGLTSERVIAHIDSMPEMNLRVLDTDKWEHGEGQNHSSMGTQVLKVLPTAETLAQFKQNGLHEAFADMSLDHMEEGTAHPTAPFHMGWIRYNVDKANKEIFIDEIQSDLYSSFRRLMKDPKVKNKEQMQSVMDTLFGKHHPSEVLHEAAHQYFRDQGFHGYKVHIHSSKSKAIMSLEDQDKPVPAHFKEGYEAVPKKMGYTPAKYGDLNIETGDGDDNADQLPDQPTHGSKIVKFEEMLFELSKGEW